MNLFTILKNEWHPTLPEDLLSCPPTVFRAIDQEHADLLGEIFGIATVADMVKQPLLDWVWRTFEVYRMGAMSGPPEEGGRYITSEWRERPCGEWLGSSTHSLEGISEEHSLRLSRLMKWTTIRNMATDLRFEAARELSRVVTGEPVSPADAIPKPLENYFAGAPNRYINRIRENAGRPPIPPPPPPPPIESVAGLGLPLGGIPSPEEHHPSPTANHQPVGDQPGGHQSGPTGENDLGEDPQSYDEAFGRLQPSARKDYASDGAYIPRGGGSRGWFENQAVAKTEKSNNYRYQEAIDHTGYRDVGVEHKILVNLRGAERKELRMQVRFSTDPEEVPQPALCLDVSLTGTKIRLGRRLKEESPVFISFVHRDDIRGTITPLVELEAQVMWCRDVDPNYKVPRYDTGLSYTNLGIDAKERVSMLMMDQLDELIAMAPFPQKDA